MKTKTITILLAMALLLTLTACGGGAADTSSYTSVDQFEGEVGFIEGPSTVTVDGINQMMGTKFESVSLYPTYNEALLALKADRVTAVAVGKPQGEYSASTDSSLRFISGKAQNPLQISMLTRSDEAELLGQINSALAELKDSGELEALNEKYVENITVDGAALPSVIQGAQMITVGVSGDNPPFDYISAAGDPSGYNVALMGAIAEIAGFNVEFVTIPFSAKFAALTSERIDVFFFHGGYFSSEGIVATDVYYENMTNGLLVKK
ncbi:MAG: transporter substrate-binding domain-containing protein [Oscillospiraceae bacterium]|jgi:ABC-type amino acid transport substrate-binding protein|nr:transporter substrate-binding domain-containing protein [Oscillospiraceae bacterium]